jgi:hypothetical protein
VLHCSASSLIGEGPRPLWVTQLRCDRIACRLDR